MAIADVAAGEDDERGLRALAAILLETPTLGGGVPHPPSLAPVLVGGVRGMICRRRAEVATAPERLLANLMEFVLAFYPEAMTPPSW